MKIILAEEPFLSIQWEGPSVWTPSIFIRFFGCNLNCKRCDSKYAVNNAESICQYTPKQLINKILTFNCKNIVFTGWEPTLFLPAIEEIVNGLNNSFTFEIETNGSNDIPLYIDRINCSPKLKSSWNKPYELKVMPHLGVIYKFVAKTREDCYEIQEFIEKNHLQLWNNIYIMPEGVDADSQNNGDVLQFCINYWYRYCLRQHILLFWNKKWV